MMRDSIEAFGFIVWLECRSCGARVPVFVFSGDTDMATSDLISLTDPVDKTVLIARRTTKDVDVLPPASECVIAHLDRKIGGRDFRWAHIISMHDARSGFRHPFQEFVRVRERTELVYRCIVCDGIDARPVKTTSLSDFRLGGGLILLGEGVVLR